MTEVFERPAAITVSVWPEDMECMDAFMWCITVNYQGHGRWAVLRGDSGSKVCLGRDGKWDWQMQPSSRTREWLDGHRYTHDEAMALAREWAPKVSVNGISAVECVAGHRDGRFYHG